MDKPLYLAGPMTGIPQFNFPAFEAAAKSLRDKGYNIISPAEMDAEEVRDEALASEDGQFSLDGKVAGETWGDFLSRDVKLIADECKGIVLMEGWEKSKGARLECFTAMSCGYPLYMYIEDELRITTYSYAIFTIAQEIMVLRKAQMEEEERATNGREVA